jgi:hypothetical protein
MPIDQDMRRYFAIGDRDDLSYEQKLQAYRALADEHFQVDAYEEFCAASLPSSHELAVDWFGGKDFDALLVEVVRATFPAHEHEQMVARHRGLIGAWVDDQS